MARSLNAVVPTSVGLSWHLHEDLRARWPEGVDWPIPEWLAQGTAQIVKKGPQRTVYRVELQDITFFLKQHHLPDRTTWWRQWLRSPKGEREHRRLVELQRRGVAAPLPLGWGREAGDHRAGESYVITRAIDQVAPLNRYLRENEQAPPGQRQSLTASLGAFIASVHRAGVRHGDLHLGNVLVRPVAGGERAGELAYRFHLVDLDAVDLGARLSRQECLESLALFNRGFLMRATRSDRLRFLAAYVRASGWFDVDADLRGPRELLRLSAQVEAMSWKSCFDFWAHRDRRCEEDNRYYRVLRNDSFTGHALRDIDDDFLAAFLADPEAIFRHPEARILKQSSSSTVVEMDAPSGAEASAWIVKKIAATRRTDALASLVRRPPALRSWVAGHGLIERGLPTPRPLLVLHRRQAGLLREGYVITEKIESTQGLDRYVGALMDQPESEAMSRLRRQIDHVARALRDLHCRQASHRDLKAANILVTSLAVEGTPAGLPRPIQKSPFLVPSTNLWFIDLVGVRLAYRVGKRRRIRDLARLNKSFHRAANVTRTDRLRFLRIYLGWGIHGQGRWKAWWRAVAAMTDSLIAKNHRDGRVIG